MKNILLYIVSETPEKDSRCQRLSDEATKKNILVKTIDLRQLLVTNNSLLYKNEPVALDDAFFWFLGNTYFNHQIIRLLETKKAFVWPSSQSVKFSNKFYASFFLSSIGIATPKTTLITIDDKLDDALDFLGGFPCVIKKNNGTEGNHVELVSSKKNITDFIESRYASKPRTFFKKASFLLQEFIRESDGADYRVLCVKNEVIGIIKRKSLSGFKSNISLGGEASYIKNDSALEDLSKRIMEETGLFYAGIDFIKSTKGYLAIEINTSAQFQGFEKATKINVAEKIIANLLSK